MKKIAIEEHFITEAIKTHAVAPKALDGKVKTKLLNDYIERTSLDLGEGRLKVMDEAGIDMEVLQVGVQGYGLFDGPNGTDLAKKTNDELSKVVKKYPKRFAGLAALAPNEPGKAADELERAVKGLGLKGAQMCSNVAGEYLDDKKFWVIYERAEKLGVPIYIHPSWPSPDILKPFMTYPVLGFSMWGFSADAGLNAMRLICSGVFDKYPGLKFILGHLGEALPWWIWRLDNRWKKFTADDRGRQMKKKPSEYIKENFFITTSGMFWHPSLLCAYLTLGADRILFAVDYPYEENNEAVEFMDTAPISDTDKEKIYHVNAEKLLAL